MTEVSFVFLSFCSWLTELCVCCRLHRLAPLITCQLANSTHSRNSFTVKEMQEPAAGAWTQKIRLWLWKRCSPMVVANHGRLGQRERLRGTAAIDSIERRITQPPPPHTHSFIPYPLRVATVKTGWLTFISATWHDLVIYHKISLRSWSVDKKHFRDRTVASTEDQRRDKTQSPAGAGNAVFMI